MSFLFSVKLFSSTTNVGGEGELDDDGVWTLNEGEETHTHTHAISYLGFEGFWETPHKIFV